MAEDVAVFDAHVIGVRCGKVLEVAADLVDELEADLRVGGAAVDDDLVAAVGEAEPVDAREAGGERAVRHHRRRGHRDVGVVARVVHAVRGALPAVAARVGEVEAVDRSGGRAADRGRRRRWGRRRG